LESTGNRGEESEYLELINGERLKNTSDILKELIPVGIVSWWKTVGELLSQIASRYDFSNPSEVF
jgi:hypothetical protein